MNMQEALAVLSVIKTEYPNEFRRMGRKEAERKATLWQNMFADDDPQLVGAAVKSYIVSDESGFSPKIGQIKAKMRELTEPETDTEMEAWNLVRKALRNSTYHAEEEFLKLPGVLQRIVGAPEQLKVWAKMPEETVQSVIASNFQRSFRWKIAEARRWEALPMDVKEIAAGFAKTSLMSLDEHIAVKETVCLPPKRRTKEDIQRDLEKMKKLLEGSAEKDSKKAFAFLDEMSSEEWEEKRRRAMEMLQGRHE